MFITGTDTGVGKTLLTALLLVHLRAQGERALAIKPFCSGGTADVDLLHQLQDGDLARRDINPFFFAEPVAPMISQRLHKRRVTLRSAINHIEKSARCCDWLLVEGSGGLLVPLGKFFDVRDLIAALDCDVVVVGRNALGTINHTRLTMEALGKAQTRTQRIVLMDSEKPDFSARSNPATLVELFSANRVVTVPYIGRNASSAGVCRAGAIFLEKTLADVLQ